MRIYLAYFPWVGPLGERQLFFGGAKYLNAALIYRYNGAEPPKKDAIQFL